MCQVVFGFFDVGFQARDVLVRLVLIEFQDACHLDFHQLEDVFLGHFAHHLGIERGEPLINVSTGGVHVFGLLELAVFVDAFFDEDAFQ